MSRHNEAIYLRHMLDCAQTALGLASGRDRAALDKEPTLRYALLHLITVLGEAASRVPMSSRSAYPGIPWRDMIGMRNMVIHGYDVVDLDILWETVQTDLPGLIERLRGHVEGEKSS